MIVKVKRATYPWAWYKEYISCYFTVEEHEWDYMVTEGKYLGHCIIKADAEGVLTVIVKIVKEGYWYTGHIGEYFSVRQGGCYNEWITVDDNDINGEHHGCGIVKSDAEIVPVKKVRVVSDNRGRPTFFGGSWSDHRIGEVFTVVDKITPYNTYPVLGDEYRGFFLQKRNVEDVVEEPVAEFKVGDKVVYGDRIGTITKVKACYDIHYEEELYFEKITAIMYEVNFGGCTADMHGYTLRLAPDYSSISITVKDPKYNIGDIITVPTIEKVGKIESYGIHVDKDKQNVEYTVNINGHTLIRVPEEMTERVESMQDLWEKVMESEDKQEYETYIDQFTRELFYEYKLRSNR